MLGARRRRGPGEEDLEGAAERGTVLVFKKKTLVSC
jgi:hypothetical protein